MTQSQSASVGSNQQARNPDTMQDQDVQPESGSVDEVQQARRATDRSQEYSDRVEQASETGALEEA